MEQIPTSGAWNSAVNTRPRVPTLDHRSPCQVCKQSLDSYYPHIQGAGAYKLSPLEHLEETRSAHLVASNSSPWTLQVIAQSDHSCLNYRTKHVPIIDSVLLLETFGHQSCFVPVYGTVCFPDFSLWKAQEQQVLSYLLTFVLRDILVQVVALPSAIEVRRHIETSFASQSRARVINTRMALATTEKGSSTVAEYIAKMKALADDMTSAGKKLDDEELSSYILAGLDSEYNGVVSSIAA
jgi:hypothetical protein